MDFPSPSAIADSLDLLTTAGACCPAAQSGATWNQSWVSVAGWPTANKAIFVMVLVQQPLTVYKLGWVNGSSVAGNIDAGIYDKFGTQLVSTGSTAQAGTSALQLVDVTDTPLAPDRYFLALAADSNPIMSTMSVTYAANLRMNGCYEQTSAFPLPSTATFATIAAVLIPGVIAATRPDGFA